MNELSTKIKYGFVLVLQLLLTYLSLIGTCIVWILFKIQINRLQLPLGTKLPVITQYFKSFMENKYVTFPSIFYFILIVQFVISFVILYRSKMKEDIAHKVVYFSVINLSLHMIWWLALITAMAVCFLPIITSISDNKNNQPNTTAQTNQSFPTPSSQGKNTP